MEALKVTTRSGLQLAVVVNVPTVNDMPKRPLVILLHGTTGWKEEGHLVAQAESLAAAGIYAVRFDAPGSGDSEGTWEHDYRLTTYIDAVDDVLEYMIKRYDIDQDRIGLWGHSMGGQVAAQVAARHPERFHAFCGSQLSPGKMSSMLSAGNSSVDGGVEIETEIFGTVTLPKAYFEDRSQYITAKAVKQFAMSQLYIAGTKDTIVPVQSVKDTFEHANEPKEYHEFPTDHMYKNDPENLRAITDLTTAFFKKHLT